MAGKGQINGGMPGIAVFSQFIKCVIKQNVLHPQVVVWSVRNGASPPKLLIFKETFYILASNYKCMKLKFGHVITLSALMLTMFSCDGCNNGPVCESIWIATYDNPSFIAEVDSVNKTMSLQVASMSPTTSDIQGEVYQSYFVGDFNVVAPFNNFVAGPLIPLDGNPYAEMIMYNSETPDTVLDTSYVKAGISRDYIYSAIGLQKSQKPRLATTTSGTMRIQKIGNSILTQVIAGGDTVSKQMSLAFSPVRFALRLGSFNDSIVSTTTAIKFTAFNVSGTSDATLFSDQFTCNSIYIP